MIFLFFDTSGSHWYLGPLLFLAPFILEIISNGAVNIFTNFFSPVLGPGFGWTQVQSESNGYVSYVSFIFNLLYTFIGLFSFYRFAIWAWSGEGRIFFRQLWANFHGVLNGGRNGNVRQPNRQVNPPNSRTTVDQVSTVLQKLPTELHQTEEEYRALTAHDLRILAQRRGIPASQLRGVDKSELVTRLATWGGSSATSCSICCDDYESGDVIRILPCRHRFHIECVDRWFYSATDYSRALACPLCNQALTTS
uniref:RING-type domain-containing protein n=1 Tax=Polytomella parva TaxID=51329 RepID=A0A7S0YDH3_9CHLO|mmetsp:Transcript_19470/g.35133  ORF Transcript_19470/g.35133 Transcript_19470/m.35133 type:complete len:252 (+) Transcript_19470:146-901(+)